MLAGRRPVVELLRAGGVAERILVARDRGRAGTLDEIRRRASAAGIPVRFVPSTELDRLAPDLHHQGVVALTGRFRYRPIDDLFPSDSVLFLDGVTDPHNLGSLLRSAECAGFGGVVVPARRAAAVTPTVRRVSAGAAELVPVARVTNLARALDAARAAGLWVAGLDQNAVESLWTSDLIEPPLALVVGSEDRGISRNVRERCDGLVSIPQSGRMPSLNVAVAGAIAMFEVARRKLSQGAES